METTQTKVTDIDSVLDNLTIDCKTLCKDIKAIRDIECVDGVFGKFMGSNSFKEAVRLGIEKPKNNELFRNHITAELASVYETSSIWNHCVSKPFGYPGDFAILELVYNQQAHQNTPTAIGQWIDKWSISTVLPRAVKARKNALRYYLESFVEDRKQLGKQQILSIACGSAREIRELPKPTLENASIHLLDHDERALDFIKSLMLSRPEDHDLHFIEANALKPFATKGNFDLIYSFGLYDYLKDETLDKSIQLSLEHLKEDGTFLFALKDHRFYPQWFYDWFYDWRFVSRTVDDGYEIASNNGLEVKELITVETGTINLFVCKRV